MEHSKAALLVLTGATCMSFAALFVRMMDGADGYQILVYRGIGQCLVITLVACLIRGVRPWEFFRGLGRFDILIGLSMGPAYCFYVFALLNTSVASALFLLSIAPVFAALLSWIFIREAPSLRAMLAIFGALIGVGIMVQSGAGLERGWGNLYAIMSALCFAIMLVMARGSGRKEVLGGNFLGALFAFVWMSAAALMVSDGGMMVSMNNAALGVTMGVVTIGMGMALIAWASPSLPSAEVSVLVLVESLLSPIWVWLLIGEALGRLEIIGGVVLLASVLLLVSQRGRKKLRAR